MRYRLLPGSSSVLLLTTSAAVHAATASHSPVLDPMYLGAASLVISLGALAALLASNRALRRELERQGMQREHEHASRVQVEQKLRLAREELERESAVRRAELDRVQLQLERVRTELAAAETRVDRLARVDEVTGTANRRRFDEALDQEIKRTVREQAKLSLLMCEIDYFEEYARRRDDEHRDETLGKVAHAVEDVFRRAGDLVARYGPAKFAVILPGTDKEAAARFAERVRRSVWDLCVPHEASKAAERLTISVGAATMVPSKLHRAEDLVAAAEHALAKAHETGHNRVEHSLLS
jgi:diguanylate cyclase (GGDEF)-like protein